MRGLILWQEQGEARKYRGRAEGDFMRRLMLPLSCLLLLCFIAGAVTGLCRAQPALTERRGGLLIQERLLPVETDSMPEYAVTVPYTEYEQESSGAYPALRIYYI